MNDVKESGVRPVVSFCVPVYNRAEVTREIVEGILVSDDPRFEVVLCDNASEEDVPAALAHIHDSRLKYYRNDTNVGAFQNWRKTLEFGDGEYLYLVIGRDRIEGKNIGRLIEMLEYARENNITYLKDGYSKEDMQVFEGIDAMIDLVTVIHPTGQIFNRELFRQIPDKAKMMDDALNRGNAHPENYLTHALLLHGKGARIMSGAFHYPNPVIDRSKVQSTAVPIKKKIEDMYFHPTKYTVECLDFIDLIDSDRPAVFSEEETDKYFRSKFIVILWLVSLDWRKICADPEWMLHYGQKVRHVSRIEMLSNIFKAYRTTKAHLIEKGTYSSARQKIMYKSLFRFIVYNPINRRARKILEPIGIWSVLRYLKRLIKGNTAQS